MAQQCISPDVFLEGAGKQKIQSNWPHSQIGYNCVFSAIYQVSLNQHNCQPTERQDESTVFESNSLPRGGVFGRVAIVLYLHRHQINKR